jgi:hypothetical protein
MAVTAGGLPCRGSNPLCDRPKARERHHPQRYGPHWGEVIKRSFPLPKARLGPRWVAESSGRSSHNKVLSKHSGSPVSLTVAVADCLLQELREGLARLGAPLSKEDFDVLASRVDTDAVGKISYSQFARAFKVRVAFTRSTHTDMSHAQPTARNSGATISTHVTTLPAHAHCPADG